MDPHGDYANRGIRFGPIYFIVECSRTVISCRSPDRQYQLGVVITMDRGSTSSVLTADSARSCDLLEREPRDLERSRDGLMAEAVASLISARANLQELSIESVCNPQAARILAAVSETVFEALSTLDNFSVAEWIRNGSAVGISGRTAQLPAWWECLDDSLIDLLHDLPVQDSSSSSGASTTRVDKHLPPKFSDGDHRTGQPGPGTRSSATGTPPRHDTR
jgi:hypothetical protein